MSRCLSSQSRPDASACVAGQEVQLRRRSDQRRLPPLGNAGSTRVPRACVDGVLVVPSPIESVRVDVLMRVGHTATTQAKAVKAESFLEGFPRLQKFHQDFLNHPKNKAYFANPVSKLQINGSMVLL